jgi:hypothetical protein
MLQSRYVRLSEFFYKDLIILKTKLTLNYYQQESRCNPILKNIKYDRESGDPLVFGKYFLQRMLID